MEIIDLTKSFRQTNLVNANKAWAIHHSATANVSDGISRTEEIEIIRVIDDYHYTQRKFSMGIGYHVVVFPSGRAYRVGEQGTQRANVSGRNHLYDGLCFIGTFAPNRPPTAKALAVAAEVIRASGMPVAGGHGSVSPTPTECPGGWNLGLLSALVEQGKTSRPLDIEDLVLLFQSIVGYVGANGAQYTALPEKNGRRVYEVRLPR